jgi:5-carboxymethyl-2-hydroxymuconate isomerase
MPHFTIEYSANLDATLDMQSFCEEVRRAALATGIFETGAVRVRAIRCEHYAIADNDPANSFIDVSARIGARRDLATRKQAGEAIFAAMTAFLGGLFEGQHFALSFEIREIDSGLSYRKNELNAHRGSIVEGCPTNHPKLRKLSTTASGPPHQPDVSRCLA